MRNIIPIIFIFCALSFLGGCSFTMVRDADYENPKIDPVYTIGYYGMRPQWDNRYHWNADQWYGNGL